MRRRFSENHGARFRPGRGLPEHRPSRLPDSPIFSLAVQIVRWFLAFGSCLLYPSHPPLRISLNGSVHAHMCETTAQHAGERLPDLAVAGFGILVEKSLGGHDDAVQAEAALRGLFGYEGLLNRMRLFRSPETLQSCDFSACRIRDG